MSEYGSGSEGHSAHVKSPISLAWVILAAVLCGVGLVLIWQFLTTFEWVYFSGTVLVVVGGAMFLSDRAGLDHA